MKIKLLHPWKHLEQGFVFENAHAGFASEMIRLNKAVEVKDEPKEKQHKKNK